MSGEQPLLVITDPAPGDGDREWVRVALDVLRASAQVKAVAPGGDRDLWQSLERRGRRRPVVVGGDALLHRVVQALHQRRELAGSLLGWVPLRSQRGLAITLGLPGDAAAAARVVLAGTERWLDLLVDDAGGIAVNSVRVGTAADPADAVDDDSSPLSRAAARLVTLLGSSRGGWRLRVEADGTVLTDLDRRVQVVGLGNGADMGEGSPAGPVSPDDGLAEVMVAGAASRAGRRGQPAARGGVAGRREGVRVVRAKAVTVSGQDFPYAMDGLPCSPVRLRTWTVEHAAWRLTVPAG